MRMIVALLVACAGCGGGVSTGSCDLRSGNPAQQYCQEFDGDPSVVAVYKANCKGATGTWADAACGHQGVLGGCRSTDANTKVTITNWFYPGPGVMTAADVMLQCSGGNATYVAP
jgi:hypothetical protein